jgi:hypothetical protein
VLTDTPQATDDRPATTPEILPETSADPTPEATQPPAAEVETPAEAQDAPKAEAPTFRDEWKKMSPAERAEHLRETWDEDVKGSPWLQGKFGSAKQRAAAEQREYEDGIKAAARAEFEAEQRAQRKAEAVKNEEAEAKQTAEQQTAAQQRQALHLEQYAGRRLGEVAVAAFAQLPEPVQAALKAPDGSFNRRWGTETDTPETGLALAIQAAITAGIEDGLKERTKTVRAEATAAARAEAGLTKLAAKTDPDTRGTAADAVTDDAQYLKAYQNGEAHDHVRARRILANL